MTKYHHGNLPAELLAHAAEMAQEVDPGAISLRELARRAGVSHSAPVHHFGTRQGLLTAVAAAGFTSLCQTLEAHRDDIYEMGVAYVMWGLDHPGHYAVMWQPRLLDESQTELRVARDRAWELLAGAVPRNGDAGAKGDAAANGSPAGNDDPAGNGGPAAACAAFSLVHGLVSIWLNGALRLPPNPRAIAQEVVQQLRFSGRGRH